MRYWAVAAVAAAILALLLSVRGVRDDPPRGPDARSFAPSDDLAPALRDAEDPHEPAEPSIEDGFGPGGDARTINTVIDAFDFENFETERRALLARRDAGDVSAARDLFIIHWACAEALDRLENPGPFQLDSQIRHFSAARISREFDTLARHCEAGGMTRAEIRYEQHAYLWAAADAGDEVAMSFAVFNTNPERTFAETGVPQSEYFERAAGYAERIKRRCHPDELSMLGALKANGSPAAGGLPAGGGGSLTPEREFYVTLFGYNYVGESRRIGGLRNLRSSFPLSAAEERHAVRLAEQLMEGCNQ